MDAIHRIAAMTFPHAIIYIYLPASTPGEVCDRQSKTSVLLFVCALGFPVDNKNKILILSFFCLFFQCNVFVIKSVLYFMPSYNITNYNFKFYLFIIVSSQCTTSDTILINSLQIKYTEHRAILSRIIRLS